MALLEVSILLAPELIRLYKKEVASVNERYNEAPEKFSCSLSASDSPNPSASITKETQNTSRSCGYNRTSKGRRQRRHASLSVCPSDRSPAGKISAPTGRNFMIIDI